MSRQLQFQSEKSPSLGPKAAIAAWYVLCVSAALWLTFSARTEVDRQGDLPARVAWWCRFRRGGERQPERA